MRFGLYKFVGCIGEEPFCEYDQVAPVDSIWLDGYIVGERMLEGIPIEITTDGETIKATIHERDRYNSLINWEEAEKQAAEIAAKYDCFSLTRNLNDDDGVLVDFHDQSERNQNWIKNTLDFINEEGE